MNHCYKRDNVSFTLLYILILYFPSNCIWFHLLLLPLLLLLFQLSVVIAVGVFNCNTIEAVVFYINTVCINNMDYQVCTSTTVVSMYCYSNQAFVLSLCIANAQPALLILASIWFTGIPTLSLTIAIFYFWTTPYTLYCTTLGVVMVYILDHFIINYIQNEVFLNAAACNFSDTYAEILHHKLWLQE